MTRSTDLGFMICFQLRVHRRKVESPNIPWSWTNVKKLWLDGILNNTFCLGVSFCHCHSILVPKLICSMTSCFIKFLLNSTKLHNLSGDSMTRTYRSCWDFFLTRYQQEILCYENYSRKKIIKLKNIPRIHNCVLNSQLA
jgi:hypothetical protein